MSVTKSELVILRLICRGKSIPAMAEELEVSEKTVQAHLHSIYLKTGGDRYHALCWAIRSGAVPEDSPLGEAVSAYSVNFG